MKNTQDEAPKRRLNKAGEWLEAHKGGIIDFIDLRAVMK